MRQTSGSLLLSLILVNAISLYAVGIPLTSLISRMAVSIAITPSSPLLQETGGEITEANWQQHPQIRKIRAIVQAVKSSMGRKAFKVSKRAFEYCEPGEDTSRILAVDGKGQARFYESEGGSDDSSLKMEHYYDDAGRLRFVFITGGAVNGSELEHRIYFDETGKRIWEKQTYKKGPGYTFPTVWPEEELQMSDAATKFASKSPCPEERSPKRGGRTRSGK